MAARSALNPSLGPRSMARWPLNKCWDCMVLGGRGHFGESVNDTNSSRGGTDRIDRTTPRFKQGDRSKHLPLHRLDSTSLKPLRRIGHLCTASPSRKSGYIGPVANICNRYRTGAIHAPNSPPLDYRATATPNRNKPQTISRFGGSVASGAQCRVRAVVRS